MLKDIVAIITGLGGVLGMVGSAIAMRFWLITLVIMSILKLTGAVAMPWFAGIFSAGAISTGLWMLFGGLFFLLLSMLITAIAATFMED